MNFTCNECNDSGSRDKLGTYLDCNACGTASMRRDLNDFVKSLGPTHPEDVALAIHQRALAMAPKQEVPAGWKLVPEDPTGDMFRAAAKIDNEMFAGGSSHGAEDGQVWAAMYDAAPEAPIAAPAAANGAMPEPVTYMLRHPGCVTGLTESGYNVAMHKLLTMPAGSALVNLYTEDQVRAILAAAGHDAALPDFCFEDDTDFMYRLGLLMNTKWPEMRKDGLARKISELANAHIRAALSGAKGN